MPLTWGGSGKSAYGKDKRRPKPNLRVSFDPCADRHGRGCFPAGFVSLRDSLALVLDRGICPLLSRLGIPPRLCRGCEAGRAYRCHLFCRSLAPSIRPESHSCSPSFRGSHPGCHGLGRNQACLGHQRANKPRPPHPYGYSLLGHPHRLDHHVLPRYQFSSHQI